MCARALLAITAILICGTARAAAPVAEAVAFADSAAAPEYFGVSPLARWHLSPFGDLRLRHERTQNIPGRATAVARARATLRAGFAWTPHPGFGAELSARAAAGSAKDAEFPRIDNDAADTVQVDRANAWASPWPGAVVRAGRMAMPLRLTELLWDADLRPWGIAFSQRQAIGPLDVVRMGAGFWRRDQLEDDGWIGVAQAGWAFREGAENSGEAVLSGLWFGDTYQFARRELGRQNRILGAGDNRAYASRFQLVDLQLEGKFVVASLPVTAAVDLVRNVEANPDGNGVRTRLAAGRFAERLGAEVGWSYLRAEREALLGAFASDDWWARTRTRGHMAWVTMGWSDWLRMRVFGTFEWRDGVAERSERIVSELTLRWRGR